MSAKEAYAGNTKKTFITQQKITFIGNKLGPLGFQSDALSELTWQMLIERYLILLC